MSVEPTSSQSASAGSAVPTVSAMKRPGAARLLLELDLTRPMVEVEPDDLVGKLRTRQAARWRRTVAAVHDAVADERVAGLVATIGTGVPLAAVQELRAAVTAFTAAGKPSLAWADTYGEMGDGGAAYLLASGFGEVWLQPSGAIGVVGAAAEVTFLRGLLDRIGVEPLLGQRREYKSAADRVMAEGFTPAHEEMMQRLTESAWEQFVDAVTAGRGLTADEVESAVAAGPLLAVDAMQRRWVDRLGYRDEAYSRARELCGGDVSRQLSLRYADQWSPRVPSLRRVVRAVERSPGVALVDVHGVITEGRSRRTLRGQTAGSASIARQLRAAADDDRIAAVVLRVDSPGGSAVGSDTIWHEVRRLRSAGTPVVASMGALAASGGYFVSCGADVIVAAPATLTGSIGVVGGKADISGLLDRIGVSTGAVEHGPRARMFSPRRGFTADEWGRVDEWLDAIYDDFTAKVAAGRSMSRDEVEAVARGRVWTGADAAERGLVDELGGLRRAVQLARDRAGLPDWAPVRPAIRVPLPAQFRPARSSDDPRAAITVSGLVGAGVGLTAGLGQNRLDAFLGEGLRSVGVPRIGDLFAVGLGVSAR